MSRFLEVVTPLFRFAIILLSFGVVLYPYLGINTSQPNPSVVKNSTSLPSFTDLQWLSPFSNSLSLGYSHGRLFVWDSSGQILHDSLSFQGFGSFMERWFPVKEENNWGYFDLKTGQYLLSPQFQEAEAFHEGWAKVCSAGVYGFIDTLGHWRIPPRFENARDRSHGLMGALAGNAEEGAWGFLDSNGRWDIDPTFVSILDDFQEGKAVVTLPGLTEAPVAFIDSSGGLAIPQTFRAARGFQENFAAVQCGLANSKSSDAWALWGFIDTSGQWLLPCKYLEVQDFLKGKALVRANKLYWEEVNGLGQVERRFPDHCRPEFRLEWIHLQCPEGEKLIPSPSPELSGFFRTILPLNLKWIAIRNDSQLDFGIWKYPWRFESALSKR